MHVLIVNPFLIYMHILFDKMFSILLILHLYPIWALCKGHPFAGWMRVIHDIPPSLKKIATELQNNYNVDVTRI